MRDLFFFFVSSTPKRQHRIQTGNEEKGKTRVKKKNAQDAESGGRDSRTEEFAPVDGEFVTVYDDRPRSSRLPHHAADLGLGEPVRADPLDRRRRQRVGKMRRLDPIEYAALWRHKNGVKRTVLCQREVHRYFGRDRGCVGRAGALRRRDEKKKAASGFSHERWKPMPRQVPDSATLGALSAQLTVSSTTIGSFVL